MSTRVRNDQFNARLGYTRGRGLVTFVCWQIVKRMFLLSAMPWPSRLKVAILRLFGAQIGKGVVVKPRVNIHLPWKLSLGDHVWLGEEAFILNFEPITIGSQTCISQRAFLCGGNHDYRDATMPYRNAPIVVEDGAWIGAQVFVAPGVCVGMDAVVTAGSVVLKSLPAGMVCSGNPCVPVKPRWKQSPTL